MTDQQSTPATTSQISGIRAHTNFQAIDATFFNLTDTEGRATAGLMVLLDRMHRPVRAELHFYEEIDGFMRDNTVRQAQSILQDRYYSREPVALRVMYVFQDRKSYDVTLPQPDASEPTQSRRNTNGKMIAAIVVAVVAVVAIGWALSRTLGGGSNAQVTDEAPITDEAAGVEAAATEAGSGTDSDPDSAPAPESTPIQSMNLPESRNARNDLSVGMRAAILPGLTSYIRTLPDAVEGENVGIFENGDAGLLIDGPITRPGQSDTIVWWLIMTDDGKEGWIPANTSQLTLLAPEE
jgi:hypothetical protein